MPRPRRRANLRKVGTADPFRENLLGILAISACNLLFLINNSMIKVASAEMPLGEILTFRGVFASILLVPIVAATGTWRQTRLLANRHVFWRTVAEILAAALYLLALFHIPIANANAILQIVPLMVTAVGAIFLGESRRLATLDGDRHRVRCRPDRRAAGLLGLQRL